MLLIDSRAGEIEGLHLLTDALRRYDMDTLVIGKTVDNELRLCGYKLPTVDK